MLMTDRSFIALDEHFAVNLGYKPTSPQWSFILSLITSFREEILRRASEVKLEPSHTPVTTPTPSPVAPVLSDSQVWAMFVTSIAPYRNIATAFAISEADTLLAAYKERFNNDR